jgi:hypothetical protein
MEIVFSRKTPIPKPSRYACLLQAGEGINLVFQEKLYCCSKDFPFFHPTSFSREECILPIGNGCKAPKPPKGAI